MIDEQEKELLEAFRRSGWPNEMLEEVTKRTESSEKGKKLFIDYINSPPPNNNTSYFKPTQAPKNTLTPDFFSIPSLDNTYSSELFANNSPQKDFASLGNLTNDASSIDAIRQNTEATRELIELLGELKQQNLFARSNLGEFPYNEEYDA